MFDTVEQQVSLRSILGCRPCQVYTRVSPQQGPCIASNVVI